MSTVRVMAALLAAAAGALLFPQPAPAQPTRIACVGDSITYGSGLADREHQSWPAVLGQLLGPDYLVGNFGVSGTTLLRHGDFPYWDTASFQDSSDFGPDIVIIMLGTNDTKPQNWQYGAEYEGDYLDMIDHYASLPSSPQVYVCTPPPVVHPGNFGISPKVMWKRIVPRVWHVGGEAGVTVIDVNSALKWHPEWFPDRVHPNADGAAVIAWTVFSALVGE